MRRVVLALLILTVAEIYVLVHIGEAIGGLALLGLLAASAALGYFAARAQGLAVIRRWRDAAALGAAPEEGLTDGLLVVLGGLLLAAPGVISDALGLLLLIPPVRRRAAARLRRGAEAWMSSGAVRFGSARGVEVDPEAGAPFAVREIAEPFDPRAEPHREVIEAEGFTIEERSDHLLGPAPEPPREER